MAMASLTSSLIARKGDAHPSAPSPSFGRSLLPQDNPDNILPFADSDLDDAEILASITNLSDYIGSKTRKPTNALAKLASLQDPAKSQKYAVLEDRSPEGIHLYNGRVKKTLRLDIKTHNSLLTLAHKKGETQQHLMQKAVEQLLDE